MSALDGRRWMRKPRLLWYGIANWLHGYKFGPVRRHRCCQHTTPSHYAVCRRTPVLLWGQGGRKRRR